MRMGEPLDPRVPWVRVLHDLDEARAIGTACPKLRALRRVAERLGDTLRDGPRVVSVRTIPIGTAIYPTKYGFRGAVPLPVPYIVLTHRCLLVQVLADGELKNVLFNPTDYELAKETPFFKKLIARYGERASKIIGKHFGTVEEQLGALGIATGDIDLVAFDHFHIQDLRNLFARFPNAHLLAPRVEWDDWDDLHPLQRAFFIEDGKRGVPEGRVVLFDADLRIGDGCVLLRTPGHTTGNQTLFAHAESGVFGCSENGVSADNWSPYESRIPGLRGHAQHHEIEVVMNLNTPDCGTDQYTSMIVERAIVDRVPDAPAFVQMFPSSETTPSALAPGIRPSMVFGERKSGTLQTARAATRRSAASATVSAGSAS